MFVCFGFVLLLHSSSILQISLTHCIKFPYFLTLVLFRLSTIGALLYWPYSTWALLFTDRSSSNLSMFFIHSLLPLVIFLSKYVCVKTFLNINSTCELDRTFTLVTLLHTSVMVTYFYCILLQILQVQDWPIHENLSFHPSSF